MSVCLETTYNVRCLCVSDGNMEDQELIEQQNKEAFLKGENVMMHGHTFAVCCSFRPPAASGFICDQDILVGRNVCSCFMCTTFPV